jgi:hypothetical protein
MGGDSGGMALAIALISLAVSLITLVIGSLTALANGPVSARQRELRSELRELLYSLENDLNRPQPAEIRRAFQTTPTRLRRIGRTLKSPRREYVVDIAKSLQAAVETGDNAERATSLQVTKDHVTQCLNAISHIESNAWLFAMWKYRFRAKRPLSTRDSLEAC